MNKPTVMVGDNSKKTTTKLGRNKGIPKAQLGFSTRPKIN